jgi:hypothetical protein
LSASFGERSSGRHGELVERTPGRGPDDSLPIVAAPDTTVREGQPVARQQRQLPAVLEAGSHRHVTTLDLLDLIVA